MNHNLGPGNDGHLHESTLKLNTLPLRSLDQKYRRKSIKNLLGIFGHLKPNREGGIFYKKNLMHNLLINK